MTTMIDFEDMKLHVSEEADGFVCWLVDAEGFAGELFGPHPTAAEAVAAFARLCGLHPVECMDCHWTCGVSAVSGSTGLHDECLERRYPS